MRVAVRHDHRVATAARRGRAAHERGTERERAIAGRVEDVELHAAAGNGEPRDGPHVGPRPRAPRRAAVARGDPRPRDEVLREDRLGVDPPRGRDLPYAQHREREGGEHQSAPHAQDLLAGIERPATATIPAVASARSPSRNCSVAGVSVCGIVPAHPLGRLARTMAVFAGPSGAVAMTSTATRLVYALTRWCAIATCTTFGRMSATSAPRVISSVSAAIFALAQRAPTPAASLSGAGGSATPPGWSPRTPGPTTVCVG